MSLVLEIEFLAGVCRAAAHSPASATPEWPPQPDRVFSGLVSAWAVRGEQSSERRALEWLEAQSPPAIHAGRHTARTAPDVFVPPNDQRASTAVATYLKIMPRSRPRQPRRFPVAYLDDPVMALVWTAEPPPELLAALGALAHDVGYIGHSASLVRCRFLTGSASALAHAAAPAVRQVYPGRLQELRQAYRANPKRPTILPGASVPPPPAAPPPQDPDWLVLEVTGGVVPDLRAAALVSRTLRRTLMSGYRGIGMADEIPEVFGVYTTKRMSGRNLPSAPVTGASTVSPASPSCTQPRRTAPLSHDVRCRLSASMRPALDAVPDRAGRQVARRYSTALCTGC